MFHAILINFDFWTPPPPPTQHKVEILDNTRFGLTYVRTEKIFFQIFLIQIFFYCKFFLVQIF